MEAVYKLAESAEVGEDGHPPCMWSGECLATPTSFSKFCGCKATDILRCQPRLRKLTSFWILAFCGAELLSVEKVGKTRRRCYTGIECCNPWCISKALSALHMPVFCYLSGTMHSITFLSLDDYQDRNLHRKIILSPSHFLAAFWGSLRRDVLRPVCGDGTDIQHNPIV